MIFLLVIIPPTVFIGLITFFVFYFILSPVRVHGHSMIPTLNDGDCLLVLRKFHIKQLKRDHLVIVALSGAMATSRLDTQYAVKRLSSIPGDKLKHDPNREANKTIFPGHSEPNGTSYWILPEKHYFLTSDNPNGVDSRFWGPVSEELICGIVLFKIPFVHRN